MKPTRYIGLKLAPSVAAIALLVGGCANWNTSYRIARVHGGAPIIVTQDAKTRNTVMVPEPETRQESRRDRSGRTTTVTTTQAARWRMCAEASPDVFSAMSASAAGEFGLDTDGTRTQAQARAAIALAEAAGTIERTQTINLLRESMYRTCERYLSGAISRPTFVVQAGRDWRAMIAILAIEQLTRAARPASTIISAGSTSAHVESATDIYRQLAIAQDSERAAEETLRQARNARTAAGDPADCSTAPEGARAGCQSRAQAVVDAESRLASAQRARAEWAAIAQHPPSPNQGSAGTGQGPNNPGGGGGAPSDAALQHVASVIGEIVADAFDTDETQLFCIQALAGELPNTDQRRLLLQGARGVTLNRGGNTRNGDQEVSVQDLCMQYLGRQIQSQADALGSTIVPARATSLYALMDQVGTYLHQGPGTPGARWNALIRQVQPNRADLLVAADATTGTIRIRMRALGEGLQGIADLIPQPEDQAALRAWTDG
jgi:hypothetical protein